MNILTISGSLRASSSNTRLVKAIMRLAPAGIETQLYQGLADLPHFTPDLDGGNPPASVLTLRQQLQAADGVLICTPEYAFGVPGTLKNALDWTVSSGDFSEKPVAAISASPLWSGGDKAHASLLLTLTALGANILEEGKIIIPMINKKLDADGNIVDPALLEDLKTVFSTFQRSFDK
ncbi:NADPH-dependent FMN reductase [Dictyobacter formicarum]|uniref:FMN reductase n=1 Tax=Dictyobacter formicarum TaxID=2778368 RepID=A0ABQ3VRW9_9CHLR|nr:NAD(P)H-dependent oxidoreductase [Dictyobacter formicarum]GHO88444.1 FMN reductase [Dictyobacter formicarum]